MSFIAGYLLGLGQGGTPPTPEPTPLSLEGIKALRTLATVTIGDYVFEIKEPAMLYSGRMETYYNVLHESGFKSGQYRIKWISSAVVNGQIAAIQPYGIAENSIFWGSYDVAPDPLFPSEYIICSRLYNYYSDFRVESVSPSVYQYHLPTISIKYACTYTSWYDDHVASSSSDASFSTNLEFYASTPSVIHNLSVDEYFDFVNDYCENSAGISPVVTIL